MYFDLVKTSHKLLKILHNLVIVFKARSKSGFAQHMIKSSTLDDFVPS